MLLFFSFADQTIYKVQLLTEKTAGRQEFHGAQGPASFLRMRFRWCGSAVCILRGTATSLVGGFNKIEKY